MKIKTKLIISFCIILFVPLLLAGAALFVFSHVQEESRDHAYGIEMTGIYNLSSSIQALSSYTDTECSSIRDMLQGDPSLLKDTGWLDDQNHLLAQKHSFLVVRVGADILFNGGRDSGYQADLLPQSIGFRDSTGSSFFLDSSGEHLIRQMDFLTDNGEAASAFVITSLQQMGPGLQQFYVRLGTVIVVILLLTAVMLVAWTYGSIITPIHRLQEGAEKIKEGYLDFTFGVDEKGEIGELGTAFEEMRQHLKENAEEKLNNERENRALISNIAHDLKTPITAVKGYAEGILDGVANTPEKVDKYVRTIYNKAAEMDTLINELTLYSKIDTNRIPYNFAKLNAAEYFGDCVEEIGLELESKMIAMAYYNYAPEDTVIIADPEQLRRVINNIISNSIKYMNKDNGMISIRVKDVGDFIQVEMEDNGRGISQRDLPYIFDRFYRADASRSSATGGSGIGLSIVSKIIEDHGGKIWAASREGFGTILYFVIRKYIPREEFIDVEPVSGARPGEPRNKRSRSSGSPRSRSGRTGDTD